MSSTHANCFVCKKEIRREALSLNPEVNLFVCSTCKGSQQEKETVAELLDSLADGLICGCI